MAGSNVNASNAASSSVLINRLTDSLKNMKLRRSSKNRSDKKQSTKVDKNGKPLNSGSSSSKQSKKQNVRCLDKIEWKKQQGIPVNRNSTSMFDNFVTNFHSNNVPKNGKRYYIENLSQLSRSYKVDDRVYKNVPISDRKADRTYDEVTQNDYYNVPGSTRQNADGIYAEIPDRIYEEIPDRVYDEVPKESFSRVRRRPNDKLPEIPIRNE